MKNSDAIAGFLGFLRDAATQRHIAADEEGLANDETQDILHRLELYDDPYNETAKLAKMLREIRRKRRKAKDCGEVAGMIDDWAKENAAAVKSLERLLGGVRKAEKRQEDRFYGNRTEILDKQSDIR